MIKYQGKYRREQIINTINNKIIINTGNIMIYQIAYYIFYKSFYLFIYLLFIML